MSRYLAVLAFALLLLGCGEDGAPGDDDATPSGDDDTTAATDDDDSTPSDDDDDTTPCLTLNCDPFPDLVFSSFHDGVQGDIDSHVYFGGVEGFSAANQVALPTWNATWNAVADLDVDGYADVVFANHHAGENHATGSYVYWGGPDGLSTAHRSALETVGAKGITAADLDGDGWPEVVVSNGFDGTTHQVDSYVYWGSSEGFSPDRRDELPTSGAAGNAAADLDGDGYADLVFASHHDDYTPNTDSFVYWGGADGYDEAARTGLPTSMAIGVSVADLDADGFPDLVFSNNRDGETYNIDSVIYWGGPGGYSADDATALPTHGAIGNAVADLDGDGHLDITFANHHDDVTNEVASVIYWGSAAGFDVERYTELPTLSARGVIAADLDLDGRLDLVFGNHCDDSSNAVDSVVYWGTAHGFGEHAVDRLPTMGAVGVAAAVP